ncbi:MAG: carbohydrate kinase [Calditrichaeota bacterium]|nr:carbohydrate kinase [Calditrichota bacterium]
MSAKFLCIGEVLWDALPEGLFLGGAPFNVSAHLNMLGRQVMFVSRVGNDRLGKEILRRMKTMGLSTDLIQTDEQFETGFVQVSLNEQGSASYEIIFPVAWDHIAATPALSKAAEQADAVIFGSLAQRSPESRQTINEVLNSPAFKVFDVNLRPPFYDKNTIRQSLLKADMVKLNDEELVTICRLFKLPENDEKSTLKMIAEEFNCSAVCLTKGEKGSALILNGEWFEHPGFKVRVADSVGAGDAFLAAFLHGFFERYSGSRLLKFANAVGAYVASQKGATPVLDLTKIKSTFRIG